MPQNKADKIHPAPPDGFRLRSSEIFLRQPERTAVAEEFKGPVRSKKDFYQPLRRLSKQSESVNTGKIQPFYQSLRIRADVCVLTARPRQSVDKLTSYFL